MDHDLRLEVVPNKRLNSDDSVLYGILYQRTSQVTLTEWLCNGIPWEN